MQFLNDFISQLKNRINNIRVDLPDLPDYIKNKLASLTDEFAVYGGYPRQFITKDIEEKKLVLKNIFSTYLLKDIRDILGLQTDFELSKLVKTLSLQIGEILVLDELSNFTNLKYNNLLKHLEILEKIFILKQINPYFTNKKLELVKSKKLYFIDNGFRNAVIDNFQQIGLRTDKGNLNENLIFSELIKKNANIQFWRTKSKAEVDFIIERNGELIPIKVKTGLTKTKLQKSLASFIRKYHPERAFIFSRNFYDTKKFEDTIIYYLPFFFVDVIV